MRPQGSRRSMEAIPVRDTILKGLVNVTIKASLRGACGEMEGLSTDLAGALMAGEPQIGTLPRRLFSLRLRSFFS